MKYCLMLLLSIQCFAMEHHVSPCSVRKVRAEKKAILHQLLYSDGLKRTITMDLLKNRCKSDVEWFDVEQKIVAYLKLLDTFVNFSMHPALSMLKRRALYYGIYNYEELEIKQDLICICKPLMNADPGYQLCQLIQDQMAQEVNKIRTSLRKLLNRIEFE